MNHIMVDIETLSTRADAVIANIGAVSFNREKLLGVWECRVDLKSCLDAGLEMDADTLKWWFQQSKEAQEATFLGQSVSIRDALIALKDFVVEEGAERVWSHGATFDIPVLCQAAAIVGVPNLLPFYWAARDTRTLFELTDTNPKEFMGVNSTAHSAIDDARAQALAVIAAWDKLDKMHTPVVTIRPISDYAVIPSGVAK